ncbi:TraR/DksA C4-type zinc finger protein [Streptomyces sp. NPDC047985]|uniref:TraR/DksA family transcriptional regulator n=1 Tax=unclassified Streptomyces TaxID=2593676 RepID=UPI0034426C8A
MVAKKSAAKKTASTRPTGAAAGRTDAEGGPEAAAKKKAATKAASAKKTAAGKTAGRAGKKTAADKTAAKKAAASKAVSAARTDAGHAAPAEKAPAKKVAARKSSKKAAAAATEAAESAEQTGAHTVVAKKSGARTRTADEATPTVAPPGGGVVTTAPGELAVRPDEDPWTSQEVDDARAVLSGESTRLRNELEAAGIALAGLMRESGDGAGDDEADTGTKNITREHEMALAANAQEMLDQTERALARLDAGTYGLCEVCGKPIGKARMQAFPRATLCVEDKQKQERRG